MRTPKEIIQKWEFLVSLTLASKYILYSEQLDEIRNTTDIPQQKYVA